MIHFFETLDFEGTLEALYRAHKMQSDIREVENTKFLKPKTEAKGAYLLSV